MNIRRARTRYLYAGVLCVPALLTARASLAAALDAADPLQFFLIDRYTYDDNLFKLPDRFFEDDPTLITAPQSLEDYINRASAGVRVRLDQSRQVFHADLRIDDVRYQRNGDLDYTGGSADLLWNWQLASEWSGRVFGTYDRAQASLANYRFFGRDIVDTAMYGAEVRYGFAGHWRVLVAGAGVDTDHGAELRRIENYESRTGRAGVEYETSSSSIFALEYRATEAEFPVAESLSGRSQGYEESEPAVRIEYAYTVKTRFLARFGYLSREYDNPADGEYSGAVWNVEMEWEPRSKLNLDIKAWHELKAYADAQSNYFVADGVSIAPKWEPTTALSLSAEFSYEDQDYTGTGFLQPLEGANRQDEVRSVEAGIDYSPRDFFSLGLAYRWRDRESNRPDFRGYDNNLASVQIKFTF